MRYGEAEERVFAIEAPAALYVTEEDKKLLLVTDDIVGSQYLSKKTVNFLERMLIVAVRFGPEGDLIPRMTERTTEILKAYRDHTIAVEVAERESHYVETQAAHEAAQDRESVLLREVVATRPKTVKGALAKLLAVAEMWGLEDIETEIAMNESEGALYDALPLVRDVANVLRGERADALTHRLAGGFNV